LSYKGEQTRAGIPQLHPVSSAHSRWHRASLVFCSLTEPYPVAYTPECIFIILHAALGDVYHIACRVKDTSSWTTNRSLLQMAVVNHAFWAPDCPQITTMPSSFLKVVFIGPCCT